MPTPMRVAEVPTTTRNPLLAIRSGARRPYYFAPMIFADLELARRLERAEAAGGASFIEARARLEPNSGAVWIDVGGTYALFDGPASPITQTFGLGLFGEPTAGPLAQLESFFRKRRAPVFHEVSPLAGVPLANTLASRGYVPVEFTSVMFMPLLHGTDLKDSGELADSRISTHPIARGEETLWSQVAAEGWDERGELKDFLTGMGLVVASSRDSQAFLALLDGEPIATGVLRYHEGVALFGGASTVPHARRRGAHRALFDARMQAAVAHGCELGMICAHPGSTSQRNAERLGFRIAYTRTKWQLV
jgi:hypothetical protein